MPQIERRHVPLIVGLGCGLLLVVFACAGIVLLGLSAANLATITLPDTASLQQVSQAQPGVGATQQAIAMLPAATAAASDARSARQIEDLLGADAGLLEDLYQQINPGVVSIQVYVEQDGAVGQAAGSGFIIDDQHIVTNNHVVSGAQDVTIIFHDGFEEHAEVLGTDADSDLAVVGVAEMPDNVTVLPLADSDTVNVGEWVIAIGNPFGLSSSMSAGIVSATGRSIPSGTTPFSIPQAIQTDAAINPGNSGGPLLNLDGEVIGVNAQIAANSSGTNSGVGFSIPSNVVRRVIPVLLEQGSYQWPWLGVRGTSVNLVIAEANDLSTQDGAYITEVIQDGPSAAAGLHGASSAEQSGVLAVPVGGDVVLAANGEPVEDFNALLLATATHQPGDTLTLTVLRNGEQIEIPVELEARPSTGSQ